MDRIDKKNCLSEGALMNLASSYARDKRTSGRPSRLDETGLIDENTNLGLSKGFNKSQKPKDLKDHKKDLVTSCAKKDSIKPQDRANIDFIEQFCDKKDENLYNMNKKEIEQMEKEKKAIAKYKPKEELELVTEHSYSMLLDSAITTAIISIIELSKNSKTESTRLNASKYLLDRKFGMPTSGQTTADTDIFAGLPQIIITQEVLEEIDNGKKK